MIHRVYSDLATFKPLNFHGGAECASRGKEPRSDRQADTQPRRED